MKLTEAYLKMTVGSHDIPEPVRTLVHSRQVDAPRLLLKTAICCLVLLALVPVLHAAPGLGSVSPTSGTVGTSVTINGSGFGSSQGQSTVKFNGTAGTPTSWTSTKIVVPVPTNATSGTIIVTVNNIASNGWSFVVNPNIASLSPSSGPVGTSITISGSGFGATQGTSTVKFAGTTATPTSWSASSIVVPVPTGASTGNVVITVNAIASNGVFYIVGNGPGIASLSPSSGPYGTSVTIAGGKFGTTQGTVTFGGVLASVTGWTSNSITAIVPSNINPSWVSVVVHASGLDSNSVIFTVTNPVINSVSANSAPVGQVITINGARFGASQGSSSVTFSGVAGSPSSWSDTAITVPVPASATSGNLIVTVNGNPSPWYAFMVVPSAQPPGLNFIQGNYAIGDSVPSSLAVPFPIAQTAGNLNVVAVEWRGSYNVSVMDSANNSYTLAVGPTSNGSWWQSVYYAKNIATAASNTITVTFTQKTQTPTTQISVDIRIAEYSGLDTNSPLDVVATASGTSTTANSGSVTTTNANDLLVGAGIANALISSAGTGYTSRVIPLDTLANNSDILEDRVVTSAGSYNAAASLSASATWVMQMVALKRAPPPSISSVSPNSGPVGTSVTITGSYFGASQGGSTVTFNGVAAAPTSWSTTSIAVPVPSGATNGNVVVTVGGQASNSVAFTVASPAPVISGLSPTSGQVGTSVTITGTNFGTTQGASTVTFNGTAGTPTSWGTTSIAVPVPSGASTGSVIVTVGGLPSNGITFTVIPPPSITSLSPTSGPVGTSVTITGSNFGASQGTSTVSFNGVSAAPATWSATSIVVPVPSGATTGNVVMTVNGLASNGVLFTVIPPPSITSLSPTSGPVGTSVTITGANFGTTRGSSTVTFNGTAATPTSWSGTSIVAPVPSGAITGSVVVTVNGLASNGSAFTVVVVSPHISASASPSANPNGWNNANVTVTFTCTAGSSPIQSCPPPAVVSTEGANQQITGTATDTAGQTATATATVNLDKTAPTTSISSPADGSVLSTAQIAVSGTITDALSGVSSVSCNGAQATISTGSFSCSVILNPGMNPVAVQATDVAGNQSSTSVIASLVFGPKVIITSPAPLALFSTNPITVSGMIDDPNASVSVNGVAGSVNGNAFTINGVPLREAKNLLTVSAVNSAGGVGSDTVDVYLDTTQPSIHVDTPTDGAIVTSPTVTVTGMVNDLVNGTVNQGQVSVVVNGVAGSVSNRSFQATNVQLVPGHNIITAAATDVGGNVGQHQIHVKLQAITNQQRISILSGDGQTGKIGKLLSQPLVVQLTDSLGVPIPNRAVTFSVQRSDGILITSPNQGRQITVQSDASGRAAVQFQLGTRLGVGNNVVSVTAAGFVGEVLFSESSVVGVPSSIHIVSGDMQKGQAGQPLPEPLVVIVTDSGGNPVSGVQVTYTVAKGGGSLGGLQTTTATTDGDGKAQAVLTLALQEGINNNSVTADFTGDTNGAAAFTSSGVVGGVLMNTTVSGVVYDNSSGPIPNATASIKGTNLSARTNAQGQFTIANAPVGNIVLYIDGSTSSRPETFPTLSFQMATVAGIDNTLNGPIFLPPIDSTNSQVVGGNQDVILTMNGVPGVKYTVFANSATFSDGSHVGRMTLSQVHADKVPMTPPNGSAPTLVGTLQPAGVTFNPPVKMELPNTDGLAPGTVVELFSFHHDVEQFVTEGTGRVSQDGSTVVSDPGFGLTVSGWHGSGPPVPPPPTCLSGCSSPSPCVTAACVNGVCQQTSNTPPGQACHQVSITAEIMDHDDPNATYQTSPATVVYGGSGPQTSDYLRLSAQTDPSVPVSTYQWSVSGNASSPYTPINTQQWTVGQIKTTTGQLNVHLVVNFSDGSTGSSDISFNIGIRTDDIAVVGWINPAGVPLPTAGVRSDVLQYFPSAGASTMGVIQKGLTTGYLGVLMLGLPLTPSAYEQALSNGISYILNPTTALGSFDVTAATLALEQLFGFNIFLDSTSSAYILDWMFHEAGNDCNVGKCPPNSFPDYSTLNNYEQDQYRGQYKLFNRLQIKYEVSSGNFSGSPAVVHRNKQIGITGDPLFGLVSAGEAGPSNNQYQIKNSNEAHYVNEGSPDRKAVLIFNTLAYPLKWNDIGSRIVEGVAFGTGKQYFVQVYPTYNIYTNLSQQDAQIPEAATPMGNFNSNPYYVTTPYGPAPFLIP